VSSVDFDSLHIFAIVCLVFCLVLFITMGTSLKSLANEALNETTENVPASSCMCFTFVKGTLANLKH
jgi:hypothetical protein